MQLPELLTELEAHLTGTFAAVDAWFDQPAEVLAYVPADQGWSSAEVLNHIGLTNHYLLILVEKGTAKALLNPQGLSLPNEIAGYEFPRARLAAVGTLHAFPWVRPAHMEPRQYPRPLPLVRQQLHTQVQQCLACLHRLRGGEGLLHRTTMSVHDLGKLNVYEYLYFLAQHAQRHLQQMVGNLLDFNQLCRCPVCELATPQAY